MFVKWDLLEQMKITDTRGVPSMTTETHYWGHSQGIEETNTTTMCLYHDASDRNLTVTDPNKSMKLITSAPNGTLTYIAYKMLGTDFIS